MQQHTDGVEEPGRAAAGVPLECIREDGGRPVQSQRRALLRTGMRPIVLPLSLLIALAGLLFACSMVGGMLIRISA